MGTSLKAISFAVWFQASQRRLRAAVADSRAYDIFGGHIRTPLAHARRTAPRL